MIYSDFLLILNWWLVLFLIGVIFLPLTVRIFSNFFDRGYIFSKILGILLISYSVWLLGSLKILPFTELTIVLVFLLWGAVSLFVLVKVGPSRRSDLLKIPWKIFLLEELIFLTALFFWSYIRAHEPSIHGLEKYMDFGFVNSILRTDYFPPKDLWMTPLSINYYYFGHLVTAVLTKLSKIDSIITFNLMMATLFALIFTSAFSIGLNLLLRTKVKLNAKRYTLYAIVAGFLTAFLVTLAGNLHTIYTFFQPYTTDTPQPFWQLLFSPTTFPNTYWYPNATRFIPFTIHEFPIYSFVVSDLHGHVLDIPFVLLTIALLLNILISKSLNIFKILLLSLLLAVMYMTNVWDGIIYFLLTILLLFFLCRKKLLEYLTLGILVFIGIIGFSLPFSLSFKPFASSIGIICAPEFLTRLGKLGPFLFEPDHCQRSPIWQLFILYGFFYFWIVLFIGFLLKKLKTIRHTLYASDIFIFILIFLSTLLIIIPEFIYLKDIYPAHYRANTMFKLTYQAFIMLSIASGYIITRIITNIKYQISNIKLSYWKFVVLVFIGIIGLFLVSIYPFFAINSYYGDLKDYQGLNGLTYLKNLYSNDYEGILWLRKNIKGQPVILEAQGDSYTDFARVSANTGLPTIIGWPVHEWLWRGSYELTSPRIADVTTLYETKDINLAKILIEKYNISLVFVGDLERQKYQNLNDDKFEKIGKIIFEKGEAKIYLIGQLPLSN